MKRVKRITALLLAALMLFSCTAFGAAASIVSPGANSIIYGDSLLVSVKLTELKTVRITVYEQKVKSGEKYLPADVSKFTAETLKGLEKENGYTSVQLGDAAEYTNTADVSFYTKQISVNPGLYKVVVETLEKVMEWPEDSGEPKEKIIVVETVSSLVAVDAKKEESKPVFNTTPSGALSFVKKLLKNLFN